MKRKSLIVGGVIVLIVLLAGAAFVGGRLLNQTAPSGSLVPGGAAAGGKQAIHIEVVPASELPASAPDAFGPFVERRDNSLFVAIGSKFMILTNKDGSVRTDGMDSGQRLEVVVTTDTRLYKDVTGDQAPRNSPPADGRIQQEVVAGALSEIGTNSFVSAWGERRGDRVVAKVVVYTPARIIPAPNP